MTVRLEPEAERESTTFPRADAELTPELIDACGLREGLEKFGRILGEQLREHRAAVRDDNKRVVAVNISTIGFTLQLRKE